MINQILLGVFGVTAVFLSQTVEYKKYACLFGLASQPFWFYETFQAQQWGIFTLCIFYAGSWGMGFYNYWGKPSSKNLGR